MTIADDPPQLHVVACLSISDYPAGHPQYPSTICTCARCDARVWAPHQLQPVLDADRFARIVCTSCVADLMLNPNCERWEFRHLDPKS